jgi:hypothetical protein
VACLLGYWPLSQIQIIYASYNSLTFLTASLLVLYGIIVGLLVVAVIFAVAAQVKIGGGYWWRHTLLGRGVLAVIRGMSALLQKIGVVWKWYIIRICTKRCRIYNYI